MPHPRFAPPDVQGLLPRRRLHHLLAASDRSMTWVGGPPGAGKTSLVASYVHQLGKPLIWYHLKDADQDPATFAAHFRHAAGHVLQRSSNSSSASKSIPDNDLPAPIRPLLSELSTQLPNDVQIVLDAVQLGQDTGHFLLPMLARFAFLPGAVRTFVTSRSAPPKELMRLAVDRAMTVLSWEDLRFTDQESRELLGKGDAGGEVFSELSDEELNAVIRRADGWAAGLVLLADSLRHGAGASIVSWPHMEDVFRYLDAELFSKLPTLLREFLLRIAFLPRMTPAMATAVSGVENAEALLERLCLGNCLIARSPGAVPEYLPHPMWALFLRATAKKRHAPDDLKLFRVRSAKLLDGIGEREDAAILLAEAGDFPGLMRLVLRHAEDLVAKGRLAVLEQWIALLPESFGKDDPWMQHWLGCCLQRKDQARARELFRGAFDAFRKSNDMPGMLSAWCGAVDTFLGDWNAFQGLDEWIADLEEVIAGGVPLPATLLGVRTASSMLGALVYRRPDQPEQVAAWLERAFLHLSALEARPLHVLAGFHAAHHAMWQGDPCRLRVITENIQRLLDQSDAPVAHQLQAKCLAAHVQSMSSGRGDLALELVKQGLELGRRYDVDAWNDMLAAQGVLGALTQGNGAEAKRYLRRLEKNIPRSRRFARGFYHFTAAAVSLYHDEFAQAEHNARRAVAIAEESGARCAWPFFTLALALACFEVGEDEECAGHMAKLEGVIAETRSSMQQFMWLLCSAYFNLVRDRREPGLRFLAEAFAMGRREGYVNIFWLWRPRMMSVLCAAALRHSVAGEYALLLIRRRDLHPEPAQLEIVHWPWFLRIYTLGRFELIRNGRPVLFEGKVQHRPLALLKMLAVLKDQGVGEEELCDLLWPESDLDQARSALATTLSRLRKILDCKEGIVHRNGRFALNPRLCWVDAKVFSRLCFARWREPPSAAMAAGGRGHLLGNDPEEATGLALEVYKGHLLPEDIAYSWTIPVRERLRRLFHGLVANHGDGLESRGAWKEARAFYLRVLDVDDLHEEVYLRLMRCAEDAGYPEEARLFWLLCQERLRTVFNIPPSSELSALAESMGLS